MNKKAFTMLELLMSIALVAFLASLAVFHFLEMREKSYAAEAVQTLGVIKRHVQMDMGIDALPSSDEWQYTTSTNFVPSESGENTLIGRGSVEGQDAIIATRKKGLHERETIVLTWDANGEATWHGDHPAVPKN